MQLMERGAVDDFLRQRGTGVLTLQTDADQAPYPVPLSFGYDGDALYFHSGGRGRKNSLIDDPTAASFVVYDDSSDVWRSVVAAGTLATVPAERAVEGYEVLSANADFPPDVTTWGEPLETTPFELYALDIESVEGRRFETDSVPDGILAE
jgi:hypothetical protein